MNNITQYWQQSTPAATPNATATPPPATAPVAAPAQPVPPRAATPVTTPAPATKPVSPIKRQLYEGFMSVATTTGQIGKRFLSHPDEIYSDIERAEGVHAQFGEMIRTGKMFCEHTEQLHSAVSETKKTEEWYGGTFNSFDDLADGNKNN
jgi:hypothetical protein